jgi:hypothetical protein
MENIGGRERNYREETERLIRMTEQEVKRENGPLGDIGLAIVQASMNCRDAAKRWIESAIESDRQQEQIYLFFEFLYFYTHMTLRKARGQVSDMHLQKLQDFLIILIPATAIDSYFAHWPSHLKEKMSKEFGERLNDAEHEYSECDADGEIARVPMLLAKNVLNLLDRKEIDESMVRGILEVVVHELEGMQMKELIQAMEQING